MAARRRSVFALDPLVPHNYVLNFRNPVSWVIFLLFLAGLGVWIYLDQREPAKERPLTAAEFRDAVHEVAVQLRSDHMTSAPGPGDDLSLEIDWALTDVLDDDLHPVSVDAVEQRTGGTDTEPYERPTYDYEFSSYQVASRYYCLRTPDFTVTDGPC